jgi:CBS-domain-containing membrane protein
MQRSALLHAQADPTPNALGWSPVQIDDAIQLIDEWLARHTGDNIVEAYEVEEAMRTYYSPYRLLLYLQDIEQKKKLSEG